MLSTKKYVCMQQGDVRVDSIRHLKFSLRSLLLQVIQKNGESSGFLSEVGNDGTRSADSLFDASIIF